MKRFPTAALEGLKEVKGQKPGLMLLDWNTPHIDGLTLLKKVRQEGRKFPTGASNYVVKPFSTQSMVEKIDQIVKRAPAAQSAVPVWSMFHLATSSRRGVIRSEKKKAPCVPKDNSGAFRRGKKPNN